MSIHVRLLGELRASSALDTQTSVMKDEDLLRLMFTNFRGKIPDTKGLQLSKEGYAIMKKVFAFWEIPLTDKYDARDIIKFNRNVRYPFYIDKKTWGVFDSDLATMLYMVDGSLKKIVEIEIF